MTVQELIDALQEVKDKSHRVSYCLGDPQENFIALMADHSLPIDGYTGWVDSLEVIEYHPDDREVELRIFK